MKVRLTHVVAVIVTGATLSSCASAADPIAVPSSTPAATSTSTSTSSPTPTAAVDTADPANWVIGFDAMGPFELGQPIAEARSAAAAASYVEDEAAPDCRVAFLNRSEVPSLALVYFPDDVLSAIWVRNLGDTASAELTPASPKTEQGIGIGSSREELFVAYPDRTPLGPEYDYFSVYSVAGSDNYLLFTLEDGVVNAIASSAADDFPNEFC